MIRIIRGWKLFGGGKMGSGKMLKISGKKLILAKIIQVFNISQEHPSTTSCTVGGHCMVL